MSTIAFNSKLSLAQQHSNSLLCVGLDPDLEKLPVHLARDAGGVYQFCEQIIEHTHPYVCGYKFNSAFFEILGARGMEVLADLRNAVPGELITIYDVKRGDIGNTARHYAAAAFETLAMDAVTVNAYMGYDAVEPFTRDSSKGAFILCYTSNPGSADFQQLMLEDGRQIFLEIARKAREWNDFDNIGLVVGATKADALAAIREVAPDLPILAPGVGAQGGELDAVLQSGRARSGDRIDLVIPISRAILYSGQGEDFAVAAGKQAELYQQTINRALIND